MDNSPALDEHDLYLASLEIARIQGSAGVIMDTVAISRDADGIDMVIFDIKTEKTVLAPAADVKDIEKIGFAYSPGYRFGQTAPRNVVCIRSDFPRNIGHLCAGPPGCPAVPCLSLGGLQPIYERGGIEAVMQRLRDFLRDAKTGTLMADGWETVPFPVDQAFRHGCIEPKFFQNYATMHLNDRSALGVAYNFEEGGNGFTRIVSEAVPLQAMERILKARNERENGGDGKLRSIPWIFLWSERSKIESDPIFEAWATGDELKIGLDRLSMREEFDLSIGRLLTNGCKCQYRNEPNGGQAVVLILGVWRPSPLMDGYFGYSDDPEARHLELRAYLVSQTIRGSLLSGDAKVSAIVGDYPSWPDSLSWVSGVDSAPSVALVGYGALGSAIFNNYIRAGGKDAIVQDSDITRPHNLARHVATGRDIYKPKVGHATRLASEISGDGNVTVTTFQQDVLSDDVDTLTSRFKGRVVLDATADERVRLQMDKVSQHSEEPVVRTEIFHNGRLGVTFVTWPGGPTLSESMLLLIARAQKEKPVSEWLDAEAAQPYGAEPMLYGFGCASPTVHLPNLAIEQHASVATSLLLDIPKEPGFAINPLNRSFQPTGFKWIPAPAFLTLIPEALEDWRVRVSEEVIQSVTCIRADALPRETGGYLYGAWDPVTRTIVIVQATGLPPDSMQTSTTLQLGQAGQTQEEQRLTRKTHHRLYLCGSWHSHPGKSAAMSDKDLSAMTSFREVDRSALRPTLMLIVADGELKAHMKVY